MKVVKKLVAIMFAAVMVLSMSTVAASAATYTVTPGGKVEVRLTEADVESINGTTSVVTVTKGAPSPSVSFGGSEAGVAANGEFYLYAAGEKWVKAIITAPASAKVGDTYSVTFNYEAYAMQDGVMTELQRSHTYTVEVVSGGSSGGNSSNNGGGSSSGGSSSGSGSSSSGSEVKVDLSKLQDLIDKASNLKKDGYTADSWNKMVDALTKAQAALSSTSQEEIDAAAKTLSDALNGLVKVDYSRLLEAIEKAKDLGKDNETNSLWLALLDALTNGNLMLGSDDQAQVDAAAKQINDLIEQLAGGNGKFCNISIHKVWPILFVISLAANVVLVVVLVKKNGTKKKNQVDNTPLVDYDISDDE